MANYILVHGGNVSSDTWNKLAQKDDYPAGVQLGGEVWDNLVSALKVQGHQAFAPTLKDEFNNNLSDHVEQICALITENDLKNIILVGHSYAGMIITGVADKMTDRIDHLVYLDAALPDPGQSLFDILTLGGFDPVAVVDGSPKAYTEKLQFDPRKIKSLPKTFIFCTESEFASVTELAKKKIAADSTGWTQIDFPTCHLPQRTMPDKLVQLLLELG